MAHGKEGREGNGLGLGRGAAREGPLCCATGLHKATMRGGVETPLGNQWRARGAAQAGRWEPPKVGYALRQKPQGSRCGRRASKGAIRGRAGAERRAE